MVQLSRELSKVAEATGDLRENVEYNALMERQAILEASISKLDKEMQKASILDSARVNTEVASIGTRVSLANVQSGERIDYMILGPWDADFEKNILSYRSPIAKAILEKGQLTSWNSGLMTRWRRSGSYQSTGSDPDH